MILIILTGDKKRLITIFRERGWNWLIEYTTRVVTGPRKFLNAGDAIHQFLNLVGTIYGPFLACSVPPAWEVDHVTEEFRRTCRHGPEMAASMIKSCQFSLCHCLDKLCQVNQLYCRLVSAAYGFCRNYARITGYQIGVTSVRLRWL